MDKSYIIIPGCCDLNRGDQALGWETKQIAVDAGFIGNYSILAERGEPIQQSQDEGYEILVPVLEHPSRKFKNKDNIIYDKHTKLKWGLVALKDFITSYSLLIPVLRDIVFRFIKDDKTKQTFIAFKNSDAIFMKGGGLIQSHGGILSTYATYYRIYHILLAHSMNKPVFIMPNSYGPFEGPGVRYMVRRALKKCKLVTAREQKSVDVVKKELNIDVPLYPDLAFYLSNGNVKKEWLQSEFNIPKNKKIVGITMRPYRFPDSKNPVESYNIFKNEMRKFILYLYDKGYMPLIVEHTFAITSHENDGDCIRDVIKNIPSECYRLLSNREMNCRNLKSVYGSCDYVIGTRFHSMIFALSNNVPGIAISYDGYKSIGIMKDMDLEEYVIDIDKVRADLLIDKFTSLVDNSENVISNIHKYIDYALLKRKELISLMESD